MKVFTAAAAAATLAFGVVGAHSSAAALAQGETADPSAADGARTTFEPDFFRQFLPQTAYDMARRVPGFSLNDGSDRRGFAGTSGNVLINGAQPTAKSLSLEDVLSRIPATNVERLELIRGGGAGQDTAGQALLLNVVTRSADAAYVWEVGAETTEDGRSMPRGNIAWSDQFENGVEAAATLGRYAEYRSVTGIRQFADAAGAPTSRATDLSPRDYREVEGSLSVKAPVGGGILSVDFQAERSENRTDFIIRSLSNANAPLGLDFSRSIQRMRERELSASYSRTIGPFSAELIALATRRNFDEDQQVDTWNAAGAPTLSRTQGIDRDSGETIVRGTLGWSLGTAHSLQFGADAAVNTLESGLALAERRDGVTRPIDLPQANVEIEEQRTEAFLTHTWRLRPEFSLQSTLGYERSTISQDDGRIEANLEYWKPAIQGSYRFLERNELRLSLERHVDQLDFDDFVSSAALLDDRLSGGNPNLRPEARWEAEAAVDLRYGEQGAITFAVFRSWAQDVVDVAPIEGFDAPANIGDGSLVGMRGSLDAPLDFLLPGGRLLLSGHAYQAEVTDPTTGRTRTVSDLRDTRFEATLRQDLAEARVTWGASVAVDAEVMFYRVREVDSFEDDPYAWAFIETTRLPGSVKLSLEATNLLDRKFTRTRLFFTPDRRGALSRSEYREREAGRSVIVRLSGTF